MAATLNGGSNVSYKAFFSPDGRFVVTKAFSEKAQLRRVMDGKLMSVLKGHKDNIRDVAFSPDGKLVATASDDKTTMVWIVPDGEQVATLKGKRDSIYSVRFSSDGKLLITASDDGVAQVWNSSDWNLIFGIRGRRDSNDDTYITAVLSPDNRFLITASRDNNQGVANF